MAKNPKGNLGWGALKAQLESLPKHELVKLLKTLHDASGGNEALIAAAVAQGIRDATTKVPSEKDLKPYRKRIHVAFFGRGAIPSAGCPRLAVGRDVIRDYKKAEGDLIGTLDLMLTYVEEGTYFTREFGDIDEAFYASLERVLDDLGEELRSPSGKPLLPHFRSRLLALHASGRELGWGYGDHLDEVIPTLT